MRSTVSLSHGPEAGTPWLRLVADNAEELIALLLLCIIGISMAAQVLLRTVFSTPLSWPEELSQFLFVWTSAFGAIGAAKRLGLVRLGVVADNLPQALRKVCDVLVLVLILALLAVLGWKGWQLTLRTSFSAATLPITWAWAYAAAPAVSILMAIRLVQLQLFNYRFLFIEAALGHKPLATEPAGVGK
jgi:TRAP-type C4-dicarboxylate transport system permease small subunit